MPYLVIIVDKPGQKVVCIQSTKWPFEKKCPFLVDFFCHFYTTLLLVTSKGIFVPQPFWLKVNLLANAQASLFFLSVRFPRRVFFSPGSSGGGSIVVLSVVWDGWRGSRSKLAKSFWVQRGAMEGIPISLRGDWWGERTFREAADE